MATPVLFPLPHATRQQVFNALFQVVQTIPSPTNQPWRSFSQHLKSFDDYPAEAQPVITLYRMPQVAEQKTFGVTKWHWKVVLIVFYRIDAIQCAQNKIWPEQLVDNFIDAVEQRFQTDPLNNRFTLGGLVWHCFIDGAITFDSGVVDNQAIIVIPLSIYL